MERWHSIDYGYFSRFLQAILTPWLHADLAVLGLTSLCNCLLSECLCCLSTEPPPWESPFPAEGHTHSSPYFHSENTCFFSAFAQTSLQAPWSLAHSFPSCSSDRGLIPSALPLPPLLPYGTCLGWVYGLGHPEEVSRWEERGVSGRGSHSFLMSTCFKLWFLSIDVSHL